MPPVQMWSRKVRIHQDDVDEEPEWLQAASSECFGTEPQRIVTINPSCEEPRPMQQEQRRIVTISSGSERRQHPQQHEEETKEHKQPRWQRTSQKRKFEGHPLQRRVRHSPEKKPASRAPLESRLNKLEQPLQGTISKTNPDFETLITQHAKGFSTLVKRGLRGASRRKKPRAKQAAIALTVARLEETLGTSFAPRQAVAAHGKLIQPWEQPQPQGGRRW